MCTTHANRIRMVSWPRGGSSGGSNLLQTASHTGRLQAVTSWSRSLWQMWRASKGKSNLPCTVQVDMRLHTYEFGTWAANSKLQMVSLVGRSRILAHRTSCSCICILCLKPKTHKRIKKPCHNFFKPMWFRERMPMYGTYEHQSRCQVMHTKQRHVLVFLYVFLWILLQAYQQEVQRCIWNSHQRLPKRRIGPGVRAARPGTLLRGTPPPYMYALFCSGICLPALACVRGQLFRETHITCVLVHHHASRLMPHDWLMRLSCIPRDAHVLEILSLGKHVKV
jgi:hypothetical protein